MSNLPASSDVRQAVQTLHAFTEAPLHGGVRACAAMRWLNPAMALLPSMRTAASPARAQGGTDDEAEEHDLSVV